MNHESEPVTRVQPLEHSGVPRYDPVEQATPAASPFKIGPSDILYILFKHKWMIGVLSVLGIAAAVGFHQIQAPLFFSEAKLLIRWVQEDTGPVADLEDSRPRVSDPKGDSIINTEMQILTSVDLAKQVATDVGADLVLGPAALDAGPNAATGVIRGGLSVQGTAKSRVITVRFQHANPRAVQPVLDNVINAYLKRHVEIHTAPGRYDDFLIQETDQIKARLANTIEELRKIRDRTGIFLLEDTKKHYSDQIALIRTEILAAETELAEKRAIVQALTGAISSSEPVPQAGDSVPPETLREFQQVARALEDAYRRERDYLLTYTEESMQLKGVRTQIKEGEARLDRLKAEFPGLTAQTIARPSGQGQQESATIDVGTELARIKAVESRVTTLNRQLESTRKEAAMLNELEPQLADLERQREMQEAQYRNFKASLEKHQLKAALGEGGVSNISVLQSPSSPGRDVGKLYQIMAGLAVGGIALGLGLAFGFELFLDGSVRRPVDVEERLRLPLFLSIPMLSGRSRPLLAAANGRQGLPPAGKGASPMPGSAITKLPDRDGAEIAPWSINHGLRPFFEALRNRLVYNFEIRNLTHSPKLVALTSCGAESGVSTIAAGLAATLSELGEGNVLLVNMHPDQQVPYYFRKGDLQVGLDDALLQDKREDAQVGDNLYVVSSSPGKNLNQILPKRFNHMIPKFRASDYDYIIFDLPPVSQISVTSQLVRHMDQVLMVVESEKTSRDAVKRAEELLSSSGAQVGVVLNKIRSYLPARLQSELAAS